MRSDQRCGSLRQETNIETVIEDVSPGKVDNVCSSMVAEGDEDHQGQYCRDTSSRYYIPFHFSGLFLQHLPLKHTREPTGAQQDRRSPPRSQLQVKSTREKGLVNKNTYPSTLSLVYCNFFTSLSPSLISPSAEDIAPSLPTLYTLHTALCTPPPGRTPLTWREFPYIRVARGNGGSS